MLLTKNAGLRTSKKLVRVSTLQIGILVVGKLLSPFHYKTLGRSKSQICDEQLRAVCRILDGADPKIHAHKLAAHHARIASPLKPSLASGPPHLRPRYLQLELSRHVLRNIARFRLHAHTLRIEARRWRIHIRHCDKPACPGQKSCPFLCPCLEMFYLRRKLTEQIADFTEAIEFTLETRELIILATSVLRI